MNDTALYEAILGLTAPWSVARVELNQADGEVLVWVESSQRRWPCPVCQAASPEHDTRHRRHRAEAADEQQR